MGLGKVEGSGGELVAPSEKRATQNKDGRRVLDAYES